MWIFDKRSSKRWKCILKTEKEHTKEEIEKKINGYYLAGNTYKVADEPGEHGFYAVINTAQNFAIPNTVKYSRGKWQFGCYQ